MYKVLLYFKQQSVGKKDNFLAKAQKLSILPTLLDIFDIRQHYVCVLYINTALELALG